MAGQCLTHLPYCSCPSPPGLPLGTSGKSLAPIFSLLGSCGQRDLPFLPLLPAEQAWVLAFLSPCAPVPNHLGLTPVWQYLLCYLLQPYFLQTLQSLKLVPKSGPGHFVSSPALFLSHSHPHAIAYKSPFGNMSSHLSISPLSISISHEPQALTREIFLPE